MCNNSFYTCKGHWFQNHPRNVVWNGCLKTNWCLVAEYHIFNNMYNISFYTCKGHWYQITRETLFQTVIKKTWCLLPEYHIFNNMYNISFYIYVKDTDSKSPKKRWFKRLLKKPDVLFLNIMFLTICTIFLFIHVKDTGSKITQETLFEMAIKETWCLVPGYHVFNNM